MEQSLGAVPAIAGAMFYTILLKSILKAGRLLFCLSLSFSLLPLSSALFFPAWLSRWSESSWFQSKVLWSVWTIDFYSENYMLDYMNLNLFLVSNVNVWHNIVFQEMCWVCIHKHDDYCTIKKVYWQLWEQNFLVLKVKSCSCCSWFWS